MDDILITSKGTYSDHIAKLKTVLQRLEKAGFRANIQASASCFRPSRIPRLRDFSYGIYPQPKKVEAILKDAAAADKASTTTFLRYGEILPRYVAEAIALPFVPSQVPWNWTKECNESFDSIKRVVAQDTLLNFPDFSKEFHIYKDASDYQLGAVIMKDGKQLAF